MMALATFPAVSVSKTLVLSAGVPISSGDPWGTRQVRISCCTRGVFTSWPYKAAITAMPRSSAHVFLIKIVGQPRKGTMSRKKSTKTRLVCLFSLPAMIPRTQASVRSSSGPWSGVASISCSARDWALGMPIDFSPWIAGESRDRITFSTAYSRPIFFGASPEDPSKPSTSENSTTCMSRGTTGLVEEVPALSGVSVPGLREAEGERGDAGGAESAPVSCGSSTPALSPFAGESSSRTRARNS
mmetsp:Transcript_17097/g.42404  ORF Transcript_17097/g.42404 Transcript_17097/m.42404 type:complete len:243 (+) Transcript_17097:2766-3494(+)